MTDSRRAASFALLIWLAWPAFAARPIEPPAPEFPAQSYWINARGLSMTRLRGRRVIVLAFLNDMNINSLRALEPLRAWDKRYGLEGLMVIGVHTPEYAFQKDPAQVEESLRRMGVEFPVILDNDRELWKAYANDGWPAFYLIDGRGRIVFDRLGEGGYEEFEGMLREELSKIGPPPGKPSDVRDPPPVGGECGDMTPEVTLGEKRGKVIDLDAGDLPDALVLTTARDGEVSTRGRWSLEREDMRLNQQNADLSALLRLIYRGSQGFAVLGPGSAGPVKFWVRQDALWLERANAGKDVRFDGEGRSFVEIKNIGFYDLVRNPTDSFHELILMPMRVGGRIFGFSFANQCLPLRAP